MSQQQSHQNTQTLAPTHGPSSESATTQMPPNSVMQEALQKRQAELKEAESPAQAVCTPAPSPLEEVLEAIEASEQVELSLEELAALVDQYLCACLSSSSPAASNNGAPEASPATSGGATGTDAQSNGSEELYEDAEYLNQMDNDVQGGKAAFTQCSPTSLAMSLLSLYDNDASALQEATRRLLEEDGQTAVDGHDPEEAIIQLMLATDWEAAYAQAPQFFENNPQWQAYHMDGEVIQNPFAQAFTAARYDACGDTAATVVSTATTFDNGESFDSMDFNGRWQFALDAWQAGGEVNFQGDFTKSGHVVHILDITDDTMVLHDPYGMRLSSGYELRNGSTHEPLTARDQAVFDRRADGRAALVAALASSDTFDAWGQFNHYERDELCDLNALEWLVVFHPSPSEPTSDSM